jgi:low affinity Fe/Cu permease
MHHSMFSRIARWTARTAGHPASFVVAVLLVLGWVLAGPVFHYSDTWQLTINTATTIVTFLMVFLLQSTQNRDSTAVQLKLDELIRSIEGAHNALLDLEELEQGDLDRIRGNYGTLADRARAELRKGGHDTDRPDVPLERGPRS